MLRMLEVLSLVLLERGSSCLAVEKLLIDLTESDLLCSALVSFPNLKHNKNIKVLNIYPIAESSMSTYIHESGMRVVA